MSPSLTSSDPVSPGESQTNHTAKSASCTRHWSNISFRSSVLHDTSVRVCELVSVPRCAVRVAKEGKWKENTAAHVSVSACVFYIPWQWVALSQPSPGLFSWSHKTLGKSNFSVFVFSPPGFKLWDHRTNLTLLAVAADDKVDADALQANTRLWKCLFSASLCWIRRVPTGALFMTHKRVWQGHATVTDRFIWHY